MPGFKTWMHLIKMTQKREGKWKALKSVESHCINSKPHISQESPCSLSDEIQSWIWIAEVIRVNEIFGGL